MKKGLKYLIFVLCLLLFAAVAVLLCAGASRQRHLVTCTGLDVQLPKEGRFVSEEDVKGYLQDFYGPYIGERIDSMDLAKIEAALDRRSAIRKCEAWTTADGMLHIGVMQRRPVVRFQLGNDGFYADETGFIFPLQSKYTPLVPVIDGDIPLNVAKDYKGEPGSEKEQGWISKILDMLAYMKRSGVWDRDISQITVQGNGDLVLSPRQGRERFIFGEPEDFEAKFSRIEDYYKYIRPAKDSAYYRTVNVKYDGQIICRQQ